MSIISLPVPEGIGRVLDVSALAYALERVPLEWWSPMLPGEDLEQARVRRAAAADMWDEALHEYAALTTETAKGGER